MGEGTPENRSIHWSLDARLAHKRSLTAAFGFGEGAFLPEIKDMRGRAWVWRGDSCIAWWPAGYPNPNANGNEGAMGEVIEMDDNDQPRKTEKHGFTWVFASEEEDCNGDMPLKVLLFDNAMRMEKAND